MFSKFSKALIGAFLIICATTVPVSAQSFIAGSGGILGQQETGSIGGFGSTDQWGAFGKAPFPTPSGDIPYGIRFQRSFAFALPQLSRRAGSNKMDANYFWGDNVPQLQGGNFAPNRLDFRYLIQDASSGTPVVQQSAAITMIGAQTKIPVNNSSFQVCPSVGGSTPYCFIRMGIERENPTYTLDVNGDIRARDLLLTSDARFKKDIQTIESGLSVLSNLRGTTYGMLTDYDFGEGQYDFSEGLHSGLIAQEVEEILPHLVGTDEQGYKGVNYIGIIPYLIEGVKELDETTQKENAALKAQVNKLEEEMLELKAQLAEMAATSDKSASGAMNLQPAELFQNVPNPFDRATEIKYFLPEGSINAELLVFDMNGRQVVSYGIEQVGNGSVTIEGSALEAGMYFYSLISNGEEIATKRMILSK